MEQFKNLPTPVQWALGVFGITAVGTGAYLFLDSGVFIFLGVLILLLLLFAGGYFAWRAWSRKKSSARLGGQLQQHSSAAPRDITDPAKRARLDDLRRKFEDGVREYKARGKDLYKLPWYVIVGPPASGKTEAIRHSNIGFPPGMQDPLQGVGGTINMNWWFTNHAVILDTAGRLMFEEVKPGETSEWREFLNLLKKNRPNCPINGLLLTISIDSLIKDSAEQIEAKAGKIAQQLDAIQRVLDVRFPVYVIVTKCDLMIGFREFFNGITDPHLQHQMLGWSNPEQLDTPFRPEQVDQHLETVLKRLRRRRLGLLRDPIPETASARRTDEVDSFFALPNSLSLIAPRLRRYLETIFVAGEWSSKPLFLRGIYFTSSMREGSALDQELAKAIGISVDELPAGQTWERERAFFLRDFFLEKAFKERGLVTRATSTAKLLRSRQVALYGSGFGALLLFLLAFMFGMSSFRNSVGDQSAYWIAAANNFDNSSGAPVWVPIAANPGGQFQWRTNVPIQIPKLPPVGYVKFQTQLKDYASEPLKLGIFRPISRVSNLEGRKRKAQRIVFEASVLRPIIQAARQKLTRVDDDPRSANPKSVHREAAALGALVKLEGDILKKSKEPLSDIEAVEFFRPFLEFLREEDIIGRGIDANITKTMAWVYTEGDGKENWPPDWLSGGQTLSKNQAVKNGLERFLVDVQQVMKVNQTNAQILKQLSDNVKAFAAAEDQLAGKQELTSVLFGELAAKAKALNDSIQQARNANVLGTPISLRGAIQKVSEEAQLVVDNSLKPIDRIIKDKGVLTAARDKNANLFNEIKNKLDEVRFALEEQARKQLPLDPKEFEQLDEKYFADAGDGTSSFAYRMAIYTLAYDHSFAKTNLIGEQWKPFLAWQNAASQLRGRLAKYQGKYGDHTNRCRTWLDRAETAAFAEVLNEYVRQTRDRVFAKADFPLVRNPSQIATVDRLKESKSLLDKIMSDLSATEFKPYAGQAGPKWAEFSSRVVTLWEIATAVLGTNQIAGQCKIVLPKAGTEPDSMSGAWTDMSVNGAQAVRTRNRTLDQVLATIPLQQKLDIGLYRLDQTTPGLSKALGDWGVFKLLDAYVDVKAARASRNTWRVKVPLKEFQGPGAALGAEGDVPIELQLDYPLPELDKWPRREDLNNLKAW